MSDFQRLRKEMDFAIERLHERAIEFGIVPRTGEVIERELRGAAVGLAITILRGAGELDPDRGREYRTALAILETYHAGATKRDTYP